jgi:hypothetical protein
MLTHDNIRAEASSEPGLTIRLVMNNYFKYDIGRSQRLLQYWEEDKRRMIKLLGPDRYIMLAIDLPEVLSPQGMLPYRPPGWVDPLGEDHFNIVKDLKRLLGKRENCKSSGRLAPCRCIMPATLWCAVPDQGADWHKMRYLRNSITLGSLWQLTTTLAAPSLSPGK